ncbi:MAG TPA: polysaccharide biosynthesis/export family protein [Stellaceae bacterium]|nr:polysaccharide biosynthesis/export family protein [Stellaceae bacterium]
MLTRVVLICATLVALVFGLIGPAGAAGDSGDPYKLSAGDRIRVTVYGEPDLSGEFDVSDQGYVGFPLIGQIVVQGLTPTAVEKILIDKLGKDYLVNPRVNVQVVNYRPLYIIGEVKTPGQYPYISGLRMVNAIALAGGYTPRARKSPLYVKHADDATGTEHEVSEDTVVLPGDVIRVAERFF